MIREGLKILFYLLIIIPFLYMILEVARELFMRFHRFFLRRTKPVIIEINRYSGKQKFSGKSKYH